MADETEQTPEQRLEWLRAHGVTVEIPEDRQKEPQPEPGAQAAMYRYTFVHIPVDGSLPYSERTVEVPQSETGDHLMRHLKAHFADSKAIDGNQLLKQFAGTAGAGVSVSAFESVSAAGSVESFSLVRPLDSNGHMGVYLYLDEVGALKKLPRNSRGNALASACGFSGVDFYGDLFIGRVRGAGAQSQGSIACPNVDFTLKEMDGDADWVRGAAHENMQNTATMESMSEMMGPGAQTINMGEGMKGRQEDDGTKGYAWEQTGDDVEIEVLLPPGTRSKQLKVTIDPRKVTVTLPGAGQAGPLATPLSLELFEPIRPDESTWTIDGDNLILSLEKAEAGGQWPMLVVPTVAEEPDAMKQVEMERIKQVVDQGLDL